MKYLIIFIIVMCVQGIHHASTSPDYYTEDQPDPDARNTMRSYIGDQINPFYEKAEKDYRKSKRIVLLEDIKDSFWTGQCYLLNKVAFSLYKEYVASDVFRLRIHVEKVDNSFKGITYHLRSNSRNLHTYVTAYTHSDQAYHLSFQNAHTGESMTLNFGGIFEMRGFQREDGSREVLTYSYIDLLKTITTFESEEYCRLWQEPKETI